MDFINPMTRFIARRSNRSESYSSTLIYVINIRSTSAATSMSSSSSSKTVHRPYLTYIYQEFLINYARSWCPNLLCYLVSEKQLGLVMSLYVACMLPFCNMYIIIAHNKRPCTTASKVFCPYRIYCITAKRREWIDTYGKLKRSAA